MKSIIDVIKKSALQTYNAYNACGFTTYHRIYWSALKY